jgi:hypothetical protein
MGPCRQSDKAEFQEVGSLRPRHRPPGATPATLAEWYAAPIIPHSTVTLLAKFLGLSMSQPRRRATW